jgi:hypothetical protein
MKWLRLSLEAVGGLALLSALIFAGGIYSDFSEKVNKATRKDVLFVLNWGGLPAEQDYKVVASYQSPRNFTGDHLDYFCIDLPRYEVAQWAKTDWQEAPEQNPLLAEALDLALAAAREHGDCIPSPEEVKTTGTKIMFQKVVLRSHQATAADIILYAPHKRVLYYVSFKT